MQRERPYTRKAVLKLVRQAGTAGIFNVVPRSCKLWGMHTRGTYGFDRIHLGADVTTKPAAARAVDVGFNALLLGLGAWVGYRYGQHSTPVKARRRIK